MRRKESCHSSKCSQELKVDLAEMLKGGVIIEVTTPDQAKIAEDSGALAVMVVEKMPPEMKVNGAISRMPSPDHIQQIQEAVSIPIMAKCRLGHVIEAQILESLFVDYIDESEQLTPADEQFPIDKRGFRSPFICGYSNLEDALSRILEGAAMVRTKGDAVTGNISEAVRCLRTIDAEIRKLTTMTRSELLHEAKRLHAPFDLVEKIAQTGSLPVPNFAAGGILHPADAALMVYLGAQSIFVGSDIFKTKDPLHQAKAIVGALSFYNDPEMLANISKGVLGTVKGIDLTDLKQEALLAQRGW